MAVEFKLPELGEDIEAGDVTSVPVKEGDRIQKDQTLLEIEAGKASMEIPSPATGTLKALHVQPGDTVKIGQLVAVIEEEGGEAPSAPEPAKDEEAAPPPVAEEPKPEPAPAAKVEAVSPPEPAAAVSESANFSVTEELAASEQAAQPKRFGASVSAAPNVRRLARELGVDIHSVPPSGPLGHVTVDDVKQFAKETLQNGHLAVPAGTRIEKMSATRKAIMEHMTHSWTTIPHVTQQDMADITRLEELRKRYAPKAEAVGAKLTMTAILIKVLAAALKVHPKFNSSIDPEKAEIYYKTEYNVGIAVDTPKGLLVPVIRNADQKSIVELAQALGEISSKARTGKLAPGELKGGTFTLTNLGGIGGSFFTPIINAPEVAILGVGRAIMDPCVGRGDGLCAPRLRLPLSLSYDHRLIDGADGARFLRWIVEAIEEPMLISLEG